VSCLATVLEQNSAMVLSSSVMMSGRSGCTPAQVCAEIAKVFRVRTTEVGLLILKDAALAFLFPTELHAAGSIPVSCSAIAARTAQNRTTEIFNNFADVKHHTFFERIRIADEPNDSSQVIQKLMSSPVIGADGNVLGVLQISRKGTIPAAAGPDFGAQDLKRLDEVSTELAGLMPHIVEGKVFSRRLRFLRY
jgi:hypothetical protein